MKPQLFRVDEAKNAVKMTWNGTQRVPFEL